MPAAPGRRARRREVEGEDLDAVRRPGSRTLRGPMRVFSSDHFAVELPREHLIEATSIRHAGEIVLGELLGQGSILVLEAGGAESEQEVASNE